MRKAALVLLWVAATGWTLSGLAQETAQAVGASSTEDAPSGSERALAAVSGRVLTPSGNPVAGAHVEIESLHRHVDTASDGSFRLEKVPPGEYLLTTESARFGRAAGRVRVTAGAPATVDLVVSLDAGATTITVTAGPESRLAEEVAQAVSVVAGEELQERMQPSIGETLATEPGVTATGFGPGSSRPVLRGISGDRVRILESGIGAGDASGPSPDHAVTVEPLQADRIEILRGPATLRYGSSAVGGVVNVIGNEIPDHLPDAPLTGIVQLRGDSAAEERSGGAALNGALGGFAWHAEGTKRKTGDYDIPGPARANDPGSPVGTVPNSAVASDDVKAGVAWIGQGGRIGMSVGRFASVYGSPAEEEVTIDLVSKRAGLAAEVFRPFGPFRSLSARFGVIDYKHREIEGTEAGTTFTNRSWEARIEAIHKPAGIVRGSVGVQASKSDFAATGEESFLGPTRTNRIAAFLFEEIGTGSLRGQTGARYEKEKVDPEDPALPSRAFYAGSGSLGLLWVPAEGWSIGLTVSRTTRNPIAEELFARGPHVATGQFLIGDSTLGSERTVGIDVALRKTTGAVRGEITLFSNRFDGYIFDEKTGEIEDNLPVYRFVQRNAKFQGAEASAGVEILHSDVHHLELEMTGDIVRAELTDTGEPLPRIPPLRAGIGVRYRGERLFGSMGVRRTFSQDRVAENETRTGGYTLWDASAGYRLFLRTVIHEFIVRGTNLSNALARNHISYTKDMAPLPGRSIGFVWRVAF